MIQRDQTMEPPPPPLPAAEQYKNCFAGRRRRVLARKERRYPRNIFCFLMVMAYAMLMIKFSFSHEMREQSVRDWVGYKDAAEYLKKSY